MQMRSPARLSLRQRLKRWLGGDDAEARAEMLRMLRDMQARLTQLEYFSNGGRATYMGQGLVLVKVVVRGAQIAFLVESKDRLISPWFIVSGMYETELTDFFLDTLRPDDHCLDIGANFGYFTCLFGRFCPQGRIIGVEPDPQVFAITRDNIHINGFGGTTSARHAAVCEAPRMLTLNRRVGRSGNTSIIKATREQTDILGEPPVEPFDVAGITIDQLAGDLGGRVDVMKVDVEGAEPLVFQGAAATIAANPDLQIVMEWSPGQIQGAGFDVPQFVRDLHKMGLKVHGLGPGRPVMSPGELLAIPYTAGILLTRQPR